MLDPGRPHLVVLFLSLAACNSGREPPAGPPASTGSPPAAPPTGSVAATPVASETAAPVATAQASAPAPSASAAPVASAAPADLPDVEVKNIGMHIGGGPNDAETKSPIKRSVEPHMDAFRACFAKASDPKKGGDVSVDLYIDRAGGKAQIKKYKSAIEGEGFEPCVKDVFLSIDFLKPKTGTTVVSYGLGFRPKK
jgi:hypothetical protein